MLKKILLIFCFLMLCFGIFIVNSNLQNNLDNINVLDNIDSYDSENSDIKEIFLTLTQVDKNTKNYAKSFNELNHNIDDNLFMDVLFQEGKDGSVRTGYYGYSIEDANGILKLNEKNSYKIELNESIGLWQGMKTFYLNKHNNDNLKIRSKLSLDLYKFISDFTIPKTQLVQLYIKDNSSVNNQQTFVDYGLYTIVEDIDKDFLIKNNLDTNGWLYEANSFEFFQYEDNIRAIDDEEFAKKEFKKILNIEGNEDHTKLIDMLDSLNNEDIPIDMIIEKYFDEENYLTWLAFNILIGNIENNNSDFYLYSGSDSDKWYFISGDCFNSLGIYESLPWQEGVSNYWNAKLHNRYLKEENNISKLTDKIEEISIILTNELILDLLDSYKPLISYYLINTPDNLTSLNSLSLIEEECIYLSKYIEQSKDIYYQSLEKPMPVYMHKPLNYGEKVFFEWDDSYDFQEDNIKYSIEISTSPSFNNIIFAMNDITDNKQIIEGLSTGHYFWRLKIEDSKGNTQLPFDFYIDSLGKYYFGVQDFFIN